MYIFNRTSGTLYTFSFSRASLMGRFVRGTVISVLEFGEDMVTFWGLSLFN